MFAMATSTLLAATWPFGTEMKPLDLRTIGLVWGYVLLWWFIQDAAKVVYYAVTSKGRTPAAPNTTDGLSVPLLAAEAA